jgi:hypothetical protein
MKNLIGALGKFTMAVAVWAAAGTAMADDCTNPPDALRIVREAGSGIGGYDVKVDRLYAGWGAFWVAQPKNPQSSIYAPYWSRNCPVPAGMTTQVLRFTLRTTNYWSSGVGNHIPVFGLFHNNEGAPNWDFNGAGVALFPYTGGGTFSGVLFEDWDFPSNPNKYATALPYFQFQDGVDYNIQINVNTAATSIWIYDNAWTLLGSASAPTSSYSPATSRTLQGGYGFSVLCNGPSYYGNAECEFDNTSPWWNTTFNVYIGSISIAWVP